MKSRDWRNGLVAVVVGTAAALLVFSQHQPVGPVGNLLWRLELSSADWRLATRGIYASPEIVIVAIDQESLSELGVWPWPRRFHADVINRLTDAGARVITLDIVFSDLSGPPAATADEEPQPSPDDLVLAGALKRSQRVVLAGEISRDTAMRGESMATGVSSASFPHELFAEQAQLGVVNIPRDIDSVVRRGWVVLSHQEELYPTLPVITAARYLKQKPSELVAEALAGGRAGHPYLESTSILVNFVGPAGAIRRVPYYQVLEGLASPEIFRDKIVLIGGTAEVLQDLYPTPMARAEPGQSRLARLAPMPGVEIQANMVATVLSARYLAPLSLVMVGLVTLLMAWLAAGVTIVWRPLRGACVVLGALLGLMFVGTLLIWRQELWLPVVAPAGACLLAYVGATVYMYLVEERERLYLKRSWQQRVSAEVLQVILENPGLAKVAGRKLVATVMFTDLRGFTTMCHTCPPEEVVERLNGYLTAMTQVIRRHGGTIHKFIGDGIMAVFGDPVAHGDHAQRAVSAALEMQEKMAILANEAVEQDLPPLRMGIGIHTGELVAGDIGSEQLLEYAVIGDTVSTASRIESLNKDHGTGVLFSGQTLAELPDGAFAVRLVATQTVRGRDEALELYTLQ